MESILARFVQHANNERGETMEPVELQKRTKSVLFWIGLTSAIYEAVINSLVSAGIQMPPIVGAIGVALATVLIYCNGNNPSLTTY